MLFIQCRLQMFCCPLLLKLLPLYPQMQPDFRLQKINEISITLNNQVAHYWVVARKYEQAKMSVNWGSCGCSTFEHELGLSSVHCWLTGHNSIRWIRQQFPFVFFWADTRCQKT